MPRIKGIPGPCRVFFTSFDCNEPAHVHVDEKHCEVLTQPARARGVTGSVHKS